MQPDLSIVIVNWNVQDLLRRCLASLAGSDGLFEARTEEPSARWSTEIIVVDNASSDGSVAMVRAEHPEVQIIANTENLGFTRANNQGLAASHGRYVVFLNPDTEVQPAALDTLLHYAEQNPAVGIIGPQLRYTDGTLQSSRRRFPTMRTFFLESTVLQRWFPESPVLAQYYVLDRPDDATSQVDWVVGACMLVRRTVLDQVGGFDESFFMYSEEMDLCRRAVDAGWQVMYLPEAVVTHCEGKSSEQAVAARDIHFFSSRVRYVQKHHGRTAAALVRSFLLLTFVYQWTEESAKWLASPLWPGQRTKQPMRRARMAAYGEVLRSGLRPGAITGDR